MQEGHRWVGQCGYISPKKSLRNISSRGKEIPSGDLLSHAVSHAVPSALQGLTSVFEMGTGGTPALEPPGKFFPMNSTYYAVNEAHTLIEKIMFQASRIISITRLNVLPRLHL